MYMFYHPNCKFHFVKNTNSTRLSINTAMEELHRQNVLLVKLEDFIEKAYIFYKYFIIILSVD